MTILITNHYGKLTISLNKIKKFIECCLKTLHIEQSELSLLLTNNQEIRELNKSFRNKDKATDILSFGMREHCKLDDPLPPHPEVLGDIVISIDKIKEQAIDKQLTEQDELKVIIVHGLLHLIGYDHGNDLEKLRMDAQHQVIMNICA